MKSIIISIKLKWCKLIASGKKTVEVRKSRPKIETPFKCYIYCTKDNTDINPKKIWWRKDNTGFEHILNGKVIGEFVCNHIDEITIVNTAVMEYICVNGKANMTITSDTCLDIGALSKYADGKQLYGWHISDLVIYDKPKKLSEFRKPLNCHRGIQNDNCVGCWDCEIKRPPQSWCYCEEVEK